MYATALGYEIFPPAYRSTQVRQYCMACSGVNRGRSPLLAVASAGLGVGLVVEATVDVLPVAAGVGVMGGMGVSDGLGSWAETIAGLDGYRVYARRMEYNVTKVCVRCLTIVVREAPQCEQTTHLTRVGEEARASSETGS
jgi:hypothetical protein